MAASKNDLFMEVGLPGTATTLSAPGYTKGATSITVGSTSNWPTATGVAFAIDEAEVVNGVEQQVPGTYNEYVGTVAGGTSITNVQWAAGVGDRNYTAGALTRVYVPVSSTRENRLAQGMAVQHNQDGTHKNITTNTLTTTGNVTIGGTLTIGSAGAGGWDPMSGTVTAVTYNGNRSYDLTTSADQRSFISPGMRIRTTRTTAAPTQCTSLNGTNQYWTDTTVAGMTFTDDFVVSAWVKLGSYNGANQQIISRYNGTSGWEFRVNSNGQVDLVGRNGGASNIRMVTSYQSIPLNKWVHVAAQLDMSAHTTTSTTSYVMIDGVDVPAFVSQSGTNPTSLIQAGNLEVGANRSGLEPFTGKIAQAAIFSAKVTQATMRGYISQGLSGTETSLVSAYSFNGNGNDLNTTNANNLTAMNAATATNADSPFGGQAGGTIDSTKDYLIVQKVSSTTITAQAAEGCTVPTNASGVASVSYSTYRAPYGLPAQQDKWALPYFWLSTISITVASTSTWYNVASLGLPAGEWTIGGTLRSVNSTSTATGFVASRWTLSTANNTESNPNYTVMGSALGGVAHTEMDSVHPLAGNISNSTMTTWYLNTKPLSVAGTTTSQLSAPSTLIFYNAYL